MNGLFQAPTGLRYLKDYYKAQCKKYVLSPFVGKALYFGSRPHKLPGKYFSALQSLCLQFATRSVRKCITWRTLYDCNEPYGIDQNERMYIYRHFIILKKGMDGYSLKGGRSIQLATLTNCSIYGAENSTDATDVHYIADVEEDQYSRFVVDQMSDKELFMMKIMGIPDIATGAMIGVFTTQAEDSKSMQFAIGRGGATSNSRLMWTRFSWAHLSSKWLTVFSPISFSGHEAHINWTYYLNQVLIPKCNADFPNVIPELVPFANSILCPQVGVHRKEYLAANKWYKSNRKEAEQQWNDWCCAESIRVKPPEPLHLTLRVPIIVLKWYFLHTLEYCEWIVESENAEFLERNHGQSNYTALDRHQILYHFRNCMGIPLSFDAANPGQTKIAANGAWRRRLWNHLEDAVICKKCGFRPWKGSPVERYFLLMFINLIEIMVPIELLDHHFYDIYWQRYLKQKFIDAGQHDIRYQTANVWSIYAQQFFTYYMKLQGVNRMTRYIHGLVFCTMHGFEMAHALRSTYRALFGSDVVERMNSVTKSVLHTSSSRFGGKKREHETLAERTMSQIMKWMLWDRYDFRERSPRLNLRFRVNKILRWNQRNRDIWNMNMPNRMRVRCRNEGYPLEIKCPLSNQYQRVGTMALLKQHPTIVHFYSNDTLTGPSLIVDHEADRMRNSLASILTTVEAVEDTLEVVTQSEIFDDWTDEQEENFDFDESTLKRRFYPKHLVSVALQDEEKEDESDVSTSNNNAHNVNTNSRGRSTILNNIIRLQNQKRNNVQSIGSIDDVSASHPFESRVNEDIVIRWVPLDIVIAKTDFNFGASWLRLTTTLETKKGKKVKYMMTWKYQLVRYITHHVQRNRIGIWIKFSKPPKFERKEGKKWIVFTDNLPNQLSRMATNGKLSLWIDLADIEILDIVQLIDKYKYFTFDHRIEEHDFAAVPPGFTDQEYVESMNAFRGSRCPMMRRHDQLCGEIENILKMHRAGGGRVCLACGNLYGVYGGNHTICMSNRDDELGMTEANNVTKHVAERLLYVNGSTRATARVVADPQRPEVRTPVCTLIQSDSELWGAVVFNMYVSFVEYIVDHKRRALFNCVEDADYKRLCCPGRQFILMLNDAMVESLKKNKRTLDQLGGTRDIVKKLVTTMSDMFILPIRFDEIAGSAEKTDVLSREQRVKLWECVDFNVRLRNHFRRCETARCSAFIYIFSEFAEEIVAARGIWSFWRHFTTE